MPLPSANSNSVPGPGRLLTDTGSRKDRSGQHSTGIGGRIDDIWAMVAAPRRVQPPSIAGSNGVERGDNDFPPLNSPDSGAWNQRPAGRPEPKPESKSDLRKETADHPTRVTPLPEGPHTRFQPNPSADKDTRRVVGVLITYTWSPEGQIFPVREGRNLIGRDPDKCDIAVPHDTALSELNSHITFRRSFVLGDMVSLNGTFLNGLPVEVQFVALPGGSRIRTGATDWVFLGIPDASPIGEDDSGLPNDTPGEGII